jgi:hypothetical protein
VLDRLGHLGVNSGRIPIPNRGIANATSQSSPKKMKTNVIGVKLIKFPRRLGT